MALISSFAVDDVYKQIKGQFRQIRQQSAAFNTAAAAGPISFTAVRGYLESLGGAIAFCDERIARYSAGVLQAYARAQDDDGQDNGFHQGNPKQAQQRCDGFHGRWLGAGLSRLSIGALGRRRGQARDSGRHHKAQNQYDGQADYLETQRDDLFRVHKIFLL